MAQYSNNENYTTECSEVIKFKCFRLLKLSLFVDYYLNFMQPFPQDNNDLPYTCPFSEQPYTNVCSYFQCTELFPLVCDSCLDTKEGCSGRHTHQQLLKHIQIPELKEAIRQYIPANDPEHHLTELNLQATILKTQLEIMIEQHSESISTPPIGNYPNQAKSIYTKIQANEYQQIAGDSIAYAIKSFTPEKKTQELTKYNEKKRKIWEFIQNIRGQIAQFQHQLQQTYIQQLLATATENKKHGNYQNAIKVYTDILNIRPSHSEALCYRALCYTHLKNYDHALADYDRFLNIQPNHPEVMSNVGHIFFLMEDNDRALEWYDLSLGVDPANHITLYNRAKIFMKKENYGEAIADLKNALETEQCADYYMKLARCYEMCGDGEMKQVYVNQAGQCGK